MYQSKQKLLYWKMLALELGCIFVLFQTGIRRVEGAAFVPPTQPTGPCTIVGEGSATVIADCQAKNIIDLRDILVGDVPLIPRETNILLLSYNKFTEVPAGIFRNLTNLRSLYMQLNNPPIEWIEERAFEGLHRLVTLSIHSNVVEKIHRDTFYGLSAVANLTLNPIQSFAPDAFIHTPRLTNLDLTMSCTLPSVGVYKFLLQRPSQVHIIGSIQCTQGGNLRQALQALGVDPDLPASNMCYTCTNVDDYRDCEQPQSCRTGFNSCGSFFNQTKSGLRITKGCMNLDACMNRTARMNPARCYEENSTFACSTCCLGDNCNSLGQSNRTEVQRNFNILFTHDISPSSPAYQTLWPIFHTKLEKVLHEVIPGRHEIEIVSIKPSPVSTFSGVVSNVTIRSFIDSSLNVSVTRGNISREINRAVQNNELVDVALSGLRHFPELVWGLCLHTVDNSSHGVYQWRRRWTNATIVTRSFYLPCVHHLRNPNTTAVKQCTMDVSSGIVYWLPTNFENCTTKTTEGLHNLNATKINRNNVQQVSQVLSNVTSNSEELSGTDVEIATDVLDSILTLNSTEVARVAKDVVLTQSNLLGSGQNSLLQSETNTQSVNRILRGIDTFAERVDIEGTNLTIVAPNLAVSVVSANAADPEFSGLGFDSVSDERHDVPHEDTVRLVGSENEPVPDVADVGIRLPRTLFKGLNTTQPASASRVHFVVYQQNTFFKVLASLSDSPGSVKTNTSVYPYVDINGHIIAGSVVGLTIQKLADPVTISFRHLERENETVKNSQCVFWDFSANSGQGGWSGRGCRLAGDQPGNRTVCQCDHLTNFALLVDVYGTGSGIDELNRRILMIVTYVGCGLSILGLLLTIISYLAYRKLRKDTPSKILIQLCFALLGLNIVYVAGTQNLSNVIACKTVAILLHYFLLATLMWMLIEAFYMYLALVKVFQTYYRKLLLKFAIVGWGAPLVIVGITLAINVDNYNYYAGYEEAFCWLTVVPMYVTVITPVAVTVLLNFVAFGLVFHQIRSHVQQKKITKTQKASSVSQVRGALSIMVLLGLTWVFAFFTFSARFIVFHYLFAIFNSLQGLFVFIFHCFLKHDVRMMWMRSLPCCPKPKDSSTFNSSTGVSNSSKMTTSSSINSLGQLAMEEKNVKVPLNNAYETIPSKGKVYEKKYGPDPTIIKNAGINNKGFY
ncbi:adhesion G-protein coupled receptor G6 isoform X2 [Lingula anatina]|uniref:Adhesion G-protein coupled receptor G6 isoform X2 n=1 Tax=Lingula anatina TaxID=7574 RepID=A0A1S3H0E3_LINAN|nr:adhesion G-protein coupled receptor G6 isoform X2 [Lingula anatina]|eukprot:XP_013379590.1 adhesion G-protein coupled receptor G6 isoform X2 [Lingula anatina]